MRLWREERLTLLFEEETGDRIQESGEYRRTFNR